MSSGMMEVGDPIRFRKTMLCLLHFAYGASCLCRRSESSNGLGIRDIVLEFLQSKWWKLSSVTISRLSIFGGVAHELKELLAENFFLPQIKFVPRECNRVANELASIGSLGTEGIPCVISGGPRIQL